MLNRYNDDFVSFRSSSRAKPNISHKTHQVLISTSITTRNRFQPLQNVEVSENDLANKLASSNKERHGPIILNKSQSPKPDIWSQKSLNLDMLFGSDQSDRTYVKSNRDQNPTGDIWEQRSLNLDLLFGTKPSENLKIAVLNAQSVRQKENLIKDYVIENDLDVLIVLESWLDKDELPSIKDIIPCHEIYDLHQLPRPKRTSNAGGGMLCIYKKNLDVKLIPAIKTKVLEVMDLKISNMNDTVRLISTYRPPKTGNRKYPVSDFYDDMEKIVSHYKMVNNVIHCGDFNVHVNKPEESETRRFMNIIESANLIQHISGKTHIKGNTLDLIITEVDSTLIKSCKVDDFLSDHAVIQIVVNLTKPQKARKKISFRKNKEIDIKELESKIDANLKEIGNVDDLTDLVDKFNQAITDAYDELAPVHTKVVIVRPPTPWSYDDIKNDKATRRKLERRWRRTGLQIDWEIYRDFRNKFNAKLNEFRNKQYSEMIEKNKEDPTTLFRVINKSLHRNQDSPMPPDLSNKELSERFSHFFADKIDKIREEIDLNQVQNSDIGNEPLNQHEVTTKLEQFKPLSEREVEETIKSFPNKQCILDPLPLSMLKECLPVVLSHITRIVNLSLQLGDLPEKLKLAIIRPLLKKLGLELELKNYRPVSNLSFLSKLIEKIIAKQFVDHLKQNKLIDPLQSAYKKFHSTETALLRVQNDILTDIDKKKVSLLVLLDLSAAFDTIDHEILLDRLNKYYGIEGNALKWFRSFLTNRSQSVIIDDEISEPKSLKYGVPQGSVLGPLLFTAYMAPLKDVIMKHGLRYHCYADDTQIYISFSPNSEEDENRAIATLEDAIKDIKVFMVSNKLKLNDEKTEVIFLGTETKLGQINHETVTVGESDITPVQKVKNLGVIFDKNLSMDDQVKAMCKIGFYHVKNLWKIRKFVDAEHANVAAHAFVTSKLDYGNTLLSCAPKYQIKKLQSVQNAAARVVTKTGKYDHISQKMKDLKWLPVNHRIKYKLNLLTWKALNGQAPEYISELLCERDIDRDLRTGNSKVLHVPKSNLKTMGDKAFCVAAPKTWNLLPRTLRMTMKLQSFRAGLRSLYFEEAYSSS